MIDFKKRLGLKSIEKKTNPIEIYDSLDRKSETGELREVQKEILNKWWESRKEDKDLIIKLHTGKGKTLIGLLILQSRLNEGKGPCLYICPNIYLVQQTCQEAEKFGIPYSVVGEDNVLPDSFQNSENILVTHVQKVFNGRSKFGFGGKHEKVESIVIDDSHACIDSISESFKIKAKQDNDLYKKLFRLFEDDLREQGEGSFLEIESGEYNTLLPVPYWSWQDKKSEVLKILLKHLEDLSVKFAWPAIKDNIENCQCFFSGKEVEISTFLNPINSFGTFTQASHRVLMSATTQNDSFFIKGLGLNSKAVKSPLVSEKEKWSGEKMILIPSLIHENLDRNLIINKFAKPHEDFKPGIVVITPSGKKTNFYKELGSVIADRHNIFLEVSKLKTGNTQKTVVFANKYDGIDLPDDACRILILDSCPFAESLTERYEESCRSTSEIINTKTAQKIEQGLGRSVRGEKDYSVILLVGNDLVKFIKSSSSSKYFSSQTKKQIDIGFEIIQLSREEDEQYRDEPFKIIKDLINQCLRREDGWKEFYKHEMDSAILGDDPISKIIDILELERKAEESFFRGEPEEAIAFIQKIIDEHCTDDILEKGWHLQTLARYKHKISRLDAIKTQISAFKSNMQLLKPQEGISYKKLSYINESRVKIIRDWVGSFESYEELALSVNAILSSLSFGESAEKFERSLQELGSVIGFLSQRPDKEFKKGPDNLWCCVENEYFLFECKSEVDDSRNEISKSEIGQFNNHCAWFEQEYKTNKVKRILVIPTKTASNQGNFAYETEIMRKGKLRSLKSSVTSFFKEFKDYKTNDIGDQKIQEWLGIHKLDINSLRTEYSEKYYQKK
ncbi:DEAD/DEAH box helicase [filamentous cyanobacterium CCT1]|nr:DEAD/DEAH box helicase [filamentous cyanobacterium CCT1]PSN81385.1 DEAD/DEAH box helicase [filamentous cyanobacterium CCP4]